MPRPRWLPQARNTQGNVITASAQRIDVSNEKDVESFKKRHKEWQDEAWRYYDEIGEIWFVHNFVANALRRIRIYPAHQPDPQQPPVAVDEEVLDADGKRLAGPVPASLAAKATVELDRLRRSQGGHGEILHDLAIDLGVPGEGTLVGRIDPDLGEVWKVYSNDQVVKPQGGAGSGLIIKRAPDDNEGIPLIENDVLCRVWRQHPHWSDWADSPMKGVLDRCDELQILSKSIRASGRSRLAGAGVLFYPSQATFGSSVPTETGSGGQGQRSNKFSHDLLNHMTVPIQDEGVAAAVMPLLVSMDKDLIEKVKHMSFDRPIDPVAAAQRTELIKRIAMGLDVPPEILLGLMDVNHWTAWQIDEQTFKAHFEPLIIMICNALTVGFLRPAMGPAGADLMVWYDAGGLLGHPNRAQDAKDAHKSFAISDASLRTYLGFTDADAPDEDEIAARIKRNAIVRISGEGNEPDIGPGDVGPAEPSDQAPPPDGGPPNEGKPPESPGNSGQASVTAGGSATAAAAKPNLGWRLAQIDRELRQKLQVAADAAVFASLEKAGAALRRKVGRDKTLAAKITDTSQFEVAVTLGEHQVKRMFNAPGDLLTGVAEPLRSKYNLWVSQAQAQVRQTAEEFGYYDEEATIAKQDRDREAGWAVLSAVLTATASEQLFNPHPTAPERGEYDSSVRVPPGDIRRSLARAGGADGRATEGGAVEINGGTEIAGGVTTGSTALELFHQVGAIVEKMTWAYGEGARERPYVPHEELDGVEFSAWDDEALANSEAWPDADFFHPGDHLYCQCDFVLTLVNADTGEETTSDETVSDESTP